MSLIPKLCRHKRSGKAYVILNGHQHFLGRWGSKASGAAYDEIINQWLMNGRRLPDDEPEVTI